MKICKSLLAGTVLALAGASVAHAGTRIMATPPAARGYPTEPGEIDCALLNLHRVERTVFIDIMDYDGAVVGTFGPYIAAPSAGTSFGMSSGDGSWCRFTVEGSTKKYRVAAIYSQGSSYITAVPGK